MTIIAIEKHSFRESQTGKIVENLRVTADSRLSTSAGKLTDLAPKIFPVRMTSRNVKQETKHYPSFGFAYSGQAVSAINTHLATETLLANLFAEPDAAAPSLLSVTEIYGNLAYQHIGAIAELLPRHRQSECFFTALLFGHCPALNQLTAYIVWPQITDGIFGMACSEIEFPDHPICVGSGTQEFEKIRMASQAEGLRLSGLSIIAQMLDQSSEKTVGGYLQVALADADGVDLAFLLGGRPEDATATLLGRNVASFPRPAGFSYGHKGVWFGEMPDVETIKAKT